MRSIGRCPIVPWLPAAVCLTALAAAPAPVPWDLPAQPLADALRALGSRTRTNILFDPPLVAGLDAPAVKADLTTEQALARLLSGQDIRYEFVNDTTVVLSRRPPPAPVAASGGPSSQAGPAVPESRRTAVGGPGEAAAVSVEGTAGPLSLSEVVITGSRILRPGMSSPTPVTVVSPAELGSMQGDSLSQGLAQLPALATSTVPQSIGGRTTLGPGTFLNLRGLGSTRNLVLLDGRRVAPSNLAGNVDINLLPQALVSSVQIVTGGASAAYGSDAVAGVTNFILDTRYTGFKADVSAGTSGHDDGTGYRLSVAWGDGILGDRLHWVASFDWRHSQQAYAGNRAWSNQHCAVIPIPGVTPATQSPENPRQTVACGVTQPNSAYGGAITSGPLVSPEQGITFGADGSTEPFVYGSLQSATDQVGGAGNYLGDVLNLITPMDNKVLFGHLTYEVSETTRAYAQLGMGLTRTRYAQTPAYFNGATAFTIYSGNPFLPADLQARMDALGVTSFQLGITPVSWGIIGAEADERAYDAVAGLRGLTAGLDWDVHAGYGRTRLQERYLDQISLANVYRAIDAVTAPDGSVRCYSAVVDPAAYGDCVPLDPFGAGAASPAALAYIHGTAEEWNLMTQADVAASVNGAPLRLPAGPLLLGAGVEWRRLAGWQDSDAISHSPIDFTDVRGVPAQWLTQVGGWATTNVLPVSGSYHVAEGYLEGLIPLARGRRLLRELSLNAAGRVTGYSQSGTVETWKLGVTWRPVDALLVRTARSRDIRAPGIGDLYSPNTLSPQVVVTDRLNGNQSVSVTTALAGNPRLVPESADTLTGGFTWQPTQLAGLSLSADYYDIRIGDVLTQVSAQDTIDRCALGEVSYCAELTRNDAGTLTFVRLPTRNLAQARSRGVDIDAAWRHEGASGILTARLIGTRLLEQSTTTPTPAGAHYYERAGDISNGSPHWLLDGLMSFERGPLGLTLTSRFVGGGLYNTTYAPGDLDPRYTHIPASVTFNTGVRWRLTSFTGQPELYFNVRNLLDRPPPLVPGNSLIGFQTNSTLYDTMGRYFQAGVRLAL